MITEKRVWYSMQQRCTYPKAINYANYGGRGIQVLYKDFDEFIQDVGPRPLGPTKFTIDRIDNDGNYEPGNCKWSTYKEQCVNKRSYPIGPEHRLYGRKRSVETRQKISQAKQGCIGHNKGKRMSDVQKLKISNSHKGLSAGSQNPNAKLTNNDVRDILCASKNPQYSQINIAKIYNVCPSVICKIVKRKTWTHIKEK